MKTGCACLRARLLHGATGNRLFTLNLRLSLVSVPVPPKTNAMLLKTGCLHKHQIYPHVNHANHNKPQLELFVLRGCRFHAA
jgi:hypothetical protein